VLPTLLDAAGARARLPAGLDGATRLALFEGGSVPSGEARLYMEFPAYGGQQMARLGNWKAVRQDLLRNPGAPTELYDLESDLAETRDVAAGNRRAVAELERFMAGARRPSKEFPFPALDGPASSGSGGT